MLCSHKSQNFDNEKKNISLIQSKSQSIAINIDHQHQHKQKYQNEFCTWCNDLTLPFLGCCEVKKPPSIICKWIWSKPFEIKHSLWTTLHIHKYRLIRLARDWSEFDGITEIKKKKKTSNIMTISNQPTNTRWEDLNGDFSFRSFVHFCG